MVKIHVFKCKVEIKMLVLKYHSHQNDLLSVLLAQESGCTRM